MIFPPQPYQPHQRFIAPARSKSEVWRTILGAVLIFGLYLGFFIGLTSFIRWHYGALISYTILKSMFLGATPGSVILLLASFLGMAVAVFAVTRLLHGRSAATLFGQGGAALADGFRVAAAILALELAFLPLTLTTDHLTRNLGLVDFLRYLPFALPWLLVQTGAEELVFRGYLQQQLAARFRSPWLWMGLPTAIFAWNHYAPETYGPNAPLICLWAAAFGLLTADLTARTGNLGAAIGFHFANNIAAFLLISTNGSMDGLALWSRAIDLTAPQLVQPLILIDFLGLLVAWLLARLVLRV